jgi:hypothetical protein
MANRIYKLYPTGAGFSNNTVDYHGVSYSVAAATSRQAHALAQRKTWASTEAAQPQGIVEIYQRGRDDPGDHLLWCGCRIHWGIGISHGDGVQTIRAAMDKHLNEEHAADGAPIRHTSPAPDQAKPAATARDEGPWLLPLE